VEVPVEAGDIHIVSCGVTLLASIGDLVAGKVGRGVAWVVLCRSRLVLRLGCLLVLVVLLANQKEEGC
jgi:hypothetical protein